MAELAVVLPNTNLIYAPGTAAVTIKNRYHKWRPRDFHADAIPRTSAPSAGIMTNTANAINAMGLEDVIQEYERGEYYVDRTISPSGGSADEALGSKQVYFNDTTIITTSGASDSNFQECYDQQTGNTGLAGLNDASDNLPTGVTTRVLFDVTNTERSNYSGKLTLDGANKTSLACIAAANRHGQNSVGGLGSTWDHLILRKAKWGMFGTPLYGQARNFYPPSFVGNIFKRIRVEGNVDIPLLFGGNQCDDMYVGEMNLINKAGARSYIYGAALVCGTAYTNGASASDYALDIQKSHFICGTMYAELDFAAPIYARAASWIEGTFKYGAGGSTVFAKKAFIYNDDISGGGVITAHDKSGDATDAVAMIRLKAKANSKRNYYVRAPFLEADTLPFAMEAGTGTLSTADKLISFFRDGEAKWTPTGTSASPSLTRATLV